MLSGAGCLHVARRFRLLSVLDDFSEALASRRTHEETRFESIMRAVVLHSKISNSNPPPSLFRGVCFGKKQLSVTFIPGSTCVSH